jgi:AcrR family transcriptional regulator
MFQIPVKYIKTEEWYNEMEKQENLAKAERTKRILAAQLMQLLEKQSFKKITVNDICQSALISRSAFYLHFEDKYDLLRYCLKLELEQFDSVMQSSDTDTFLSFALNSILEKKKFYYNTFVAEPNQELTDIFFKLFSQFFSMRIVKLQKNGVELPGTVDIISAFYAGGVVCSIVQWIKDDFDIAIEEMVACQKSLLSGLA